MQTVAVQVTPRAGRDEVVGVRLDGAGLPEVQVRVTAAPDGGKANKAVCQLVAKSIGVAKGKVSVARGQTSRHKALRIDCTAERFDAWTQSLTELS